MIRIFLFMLLVGNAFADKLNVVVTIKPIHSMVKAIGYGVFTPTLLLGKNTSPHTFTLKPRQVSYINNADVLFWVGQELETPLVKMLSDRKEAFSLLSIKELNLRTYSDEHTHEHAHDHKHSCSSHGCDHKHEGIDPHIWLDPDNAIKIASYIADRLSAIDPLNFEIYQRNLDIYLNKIKEQISEAKEILKPYKKIGFYTLHDAYGYYASYFDLNYLGAVHPDGEQGLTINQMHELSKGIKNEKVRFVFSEPQFSSKVITTIAIDHGLVVGELDPEGSDFPELITDMARSMVTTFKK